MPIAYYNEFNPFAAEWLRNLIKADLIAPGDVDERSIEEVKSSDLKGYTQCHFFAGIGGWSYAARLAGWPDERPIWTGSAPCQPFSIANSGHGGAKGKNDPRHLAPKFISLIRECNAPIVFGEQVANAIKWGWLDECFQSLEDDNYACAAVLIPACAIGAPHERKRLYWMADSSSKRWQRHQQNKAISFSVKPQQSINRDAFVKARQSLANNYFDLLPHDGVSIAVERKRTHGYGNAIVPQVAAEVIKAYLEMTCES